MKKSLKKWNGKNVLEQERKNGQAKILHKKTHTFTIASKFFREQLKITSDNKKNIYTLAWKMRVLLLVIFLLPIRPTNRTKYRISVQKKNKKEASNNSTELQLSQLLKPKWLPHFCAEKNQKLIFERQEITEHNELSPSNSKI